jgi:hypothetical protein
LWFEFERESESPYGASPQEDDLKVRTSNLAKVLNGVWASWELPSSVNNPPEVIRNSRPVAAIASDGGIDCLTPDIRVRVDTFAVQQWI